jgi:hypothetical protein
MDMRTVLHMVIFLVLSYGIVSATIINVPNDYTTIQAAIDNSLDGDTVIVQPSTYYENINYNGHRIVLGSLFLTTSDTSYISTTIIDGGSLDAVVKFLSGEDGNTVLSGFTIQNGDGGGIICQNCNPVIDHCIITNNYDNVGGGMECMSGGSPTVSNSSLIGNSASSAAALFCNDSAPVFTDCVIKNNNANIDAGGLLLSNESHATLQNTVCTGNTAGEDGGFMLCRESSPNFENCQILYNTAGLRGGAIHTYNYYHWTHYAPTFTDCIIAHNEAQWGGGIKLGTLDDGGEAFFYSCTIDSNHATDSGGGFHSYKSDIVLKNSICSNNTAVNHGAFMEIDRTWLKMTGCLIIRNISGNRGGGFYINDSEYPSIVNIVNCTISDNTAGIGGGVYCTGGAPDFLNCILWDNSPDEIYGNNSVLKFCDINGGWAGVGNIDIDPLFRDSSNNDYHLMAIICGNVADSPCIDVGRPRIADLLLDCSHGLGGDRSDMGAYGGGGIYGTPVLSDLGMLIIAILLIAAGTIVIIRRQKKFAKARIKDDR